MTGQTITYALEMDARGQRFWLCRHPDGQLEPLIPGGMLRFLSGPNDDPGCEGAASFPVGTLVVLEIPSPEVARRAEQGALRQVARIAVQQAHRARTGETLSDDAVDQAIDRSLRDAKSFIAEQKPAAPRGRWERFLDWLARLLGARR